VGIAHAVRKSAGIGIGRHPGRRRRGHKGEPLTDDFPGEPPYTFTGGTNDRVGIDVSGDPNLDLERKAALILMRE
jgi:arylsulfatase